MTGKLSNGKKDLLLAWLCAAVFLTAGVSSVDGQSSDETYCVDSGYLYRTIQGVNNGQGICQFTDYTWCDAHAFATGQCNVNSFGFYNPYGYYYPYSNFYGASYSGLTPGEAIDSCTNSGGQVESVHTPYGDVDVCAFPGGRTVDLYRLYNGALGNYWPYYAYSWLNSP